MRRLSSEDIVRVWEYGFNRNHVERSLALLAPAFPELDRSALGALTIGNRDLRLLALKEHLSGSELKGVARCPNCETELAFTLKTTDIRQGDFNQQIPPYFTENLEGFQMVFRLPNSFDQLTMMGAGDPEIASRILLQRIIHSATYKSDALTPDRLPPEAMEALGDRINELDPQAEIQFAMNCAACAHRWSALFEVGHFVWREIRDQARNILNDVISLASAFGWTEREILDMTPQRREFYLDRL